MSEEAWEQQWPQLGPQAQHQAGTWVDAAESRQVDSPRWGARMARQDGQPAGPGRAGYSRAGGEAGAGRPCSRCSRGWGTWQPCRRGGPDGASGCRQCSWGVAIAAEAAPTAMGCAGGMGGSAHACGPADVEHVASQQGDRHGGPPCRASVSSVGAADCSGFSAQLGRREDGSGGRRATPGQAPAQVRSLAELYSWQAAHLLLHGNPLQSLRSGRHIVHCCLANLYPAGTMDRRGFRVCLRDAIMGPFALQTRINILPVGLHLLRQYLAATTHSLPCRELANPGLPITHLQSIAIYICVQKMRPAVPGTQATLRQHVRVLVPRMHTCGQQSFCMPAPS